MDMIIGSLEHWAELLDGMHGVGGEEEAAGGHNQWPLNESLSLACKLVSLVTQVTQGASGLVLYKY
jgi:hypothetical protein